MQTNVIRKGAQLETKKKKYFNDY